MRVGLFGGTYNPIHNGHLMVAEQVCRHFSLDRLYIIPCRLPPHKHPAFLASASHRVRMIERALPDDDRYRISLVEVDRSGPSYTIDTVTHFNALMGKRAVLFLPLGMDAFLEIHTWKSHARLLASIQPVIVSRHLKSNTGVEQDMPRLDRYIRSRLSDRYHFDAEGSSWRYSGGRPIHLLPVEPLAVSSSQIRQRTKHGKSISTLVPPAVQAYIEEKELYR